MTCRFSLPCRAFRFSWLFLSVLAFAGSRARGEIVITEIHYAPVDELGQPLPDLEFIELFNDGPEPYDLQGCRFTRGLQFQFTERLFLDARSYLVVCRNVDAVKSHYGITSATGNFLGALDNAGETVELSNPQGISMSSVSYNDRNRWPAGAKGTGHSLSLKDPYSDESDPDSWALSVQMGGTPAASNFGGEASFQDSVLIEAGDTWRYFKGTTEPSSPTTSWRQLGFNDAGWLSGPTGIGYGDGDDATELGDMRNNYMTVFCRKVFTVADASDVDDLVLSITYDDGFYAYLNGTEIASRNVSGRDHDDAASRAGEPTLEDINVSSFKGELRDGSNVLAVQVHNAGLSSSDLSFIPRLLSRKVILPENTETVPVVINEGFFRNNGGGERFIELYNTSASPVDLAGYHLSDDFTDLTKYVIQAPATLPAHGHLSFTETQLGFDLSYVPLSRERIPMALSNPAGSRVVDAAIFEPEVDGKSEARVPDGYKKFQPAADPTPGSANRTTVEDGVIFNEIMYHPITLLEVDEYIELYNKGDHPVDLGDWRIEGVDFSFPPGVTIGVDAYLVVARDPARIRTVYQLADSVVVSTGWAGRLRDSGERLNLVDSSGNVVDSVRFHDGGEWAAWADGGGSSLERIDPEAETNAAGTWDASDDSGKAQTVTISYGNVPYGGGESDFGMMLAQQGIAIIDDISLVRSGSSTNLISNGTFDSSTSPWRIEGTHIRSGRTTDSSEVISGQGSLKLICWNGAGNYKVNRVETDTSRQSSGNYNVTFKARWVVGSPRIISIGDYNVGQPQNPGLAGSNVVAIPRKLGTPGEINSVTLRQIDRIGSSNVGPSIDKVRHAPGVPENGEPVTVQARVRDPDGVADVTLFYRTERPTGTFTARAMSDADGDGVYTATIAGQNQGIRVLFFVEATDATGTGSRFPADILSRTHPPVLRPDAAAANDERYCMYRHDTRIVSTTHHSYRFILNQESEDYLRSRKELSNEMVLGTFVFGSDKVYYNAGLRFAGSPWLRHNGWGNSYSVRMPKDNWLHGRKRTFNLDQHASDGRERLSHYLLRHSAGSTRLPYFDFQALVRFQVNDVRDATYEALDKPNSQYIDFWFPDESDGLVFEMDDRFSFNDGGSKTGNAEGHVLYPPYGSTSGGVNKENYRWYFNPRSHADLDYFDPLIEMCRTMDSRVTSNSQFDRVIFQTLDVEEVLRVWAVRLNTDDWDTWGGNRGKNCYFFQSPVTGLWTLVPWDLELTYGNTGAFPLPSSPAQNINNHFGEVQRMLNRPRIKRMYYGILAEQVDADDGFFHSTFLNPWFQKVSAAGVGNTGGPRSFIDSRAGMIRNWIRSAVYPQVRLTVTTNGGDPFTATEPVVGLEGNAPADIFFFLVLRNGVQLDNPAPVFDFSTSDMKKWTASNIALAPDKNTLTILGFGSSGQIVDQTSIEITSSVNWDAPGVTDVSPQSGAPGDAFEILGTGFHDGLRVVFASGQTTDDFTLDEDSDPQRIVALVPDGLSAGASNVRVQNIDGQQSDPWNFTVLPALEPFVRGDANASGVVDVSDALKILLYLFEGSPASCLDALDADDSGSIEVTDAMVVLRHLFQGGAAPGEPYPVKGSDPTRADPLDCAAGLP